MHAGRGRLDATAGDAADDAALEAADDDAEGGAVTAAGRAAGSGGTFSQLDPSESRPKSASDTGATGAELRSMRGISYHQPPPACDRRSMVARRARSRPTAVDLVSRI